MRLNIIYIIFSIKYYEINFIFVNNSKILIILNNQISIISIILLKISRLKKSSAIIKKQYKK
jgi:hypothetical protein